MSKYDPETELELNSGAENQPWLSHNIKINWLIVSAIATIILWQIPWGNYILYPFSILATWFHEMGHGLTALLLGGNFQKLEIFANGSGLATHSGGLFLGRVGRALVAAGGPLGPAVAGSLFILAGRNRKTAKSTLLFLGALLVVSALIWVRSAFGGLVIPLWGIAILGIALRAPRTFHVPTIQFLGVQACVSTYHQVGYLFTHRVVINGSGIPSDTGQIAQQLFLPHWFWASLICLISIFLLVQSLRLSRE